MTAGVINISEAIKRQAAFRKKYKLYRGAPLKGECYSCKKQIYNRITVEEASKEHITSCPYCNRDFCD